MLVVTALVAGRRIAWLTKLVRSGHPAPGRWDGVETPAGRQRASRFYGSHTRAAWVILGMITLVVVTLLLYRGAQYNTGHFPWGRSKAPFASYLVSRALGDGAYNQGVETFFLLAQ